MPLISDTASLSDVVDELSEKPFMTIDTEFLRDKTYYPKLCLIQVAGPGVEARAIDPLAPEIDLEPLLDLLVNSDIVKVFHACRQDIEIFYHMTGKIPAPLFDTQVAAMVCGYGDQAGYRKLVRQICEEHLDKGPQFTDWTRRPLSKKQLVYALNDVTFLRQIYRHLSETLEERGRREWVEEEMETLTSPETYENPPEDAWERVKIRTRKPEVLSVLREVAAWREREAQSRDVPRRRVMKDHSLVDIAVHAPETAKNLAKTKGISSSLAKGRIGKELLEAVKKGKDTPPEEQPQLKKRRSFPSHMKPILEMLRMLLRIRAAEHDVAARLIANKRDLEELVMDDKADIPALKGWRRRVYGEMALAMKHGKIALTLKDNEICRIDVSSSG